MTWAAGSGDGAWAWGLVWVGAGAGLVGAATGEGIDPNAVVSRHFM